MVKSCTNNAQFSCDTNVGGELKMAERSTRSPCNRRMNPTLGLFAIEEP